MLSAKNLKELRTNNYERALILTPREFFDIISEVPKDKRTMKIFAYTGVRELEFKVRSKRYKCYLENGINCCNCGIEGKFFALERDRLNTGERFHFNLYGFTEQGREILMTVDHITPVSKGGTDYVDNLQTMCRVCNGLKDSVHEGEL